MFCVIMSDEHNASVLGCYGNKIVRTPNLDRLAAARRRVRGGLLQLAAVRPFAAVVHRRQVRLPGRGAGTTTAACRRATTRRCRGS